MLSNCLFHFTIWKEVIKNIQNIYKNIYKIYTKTPVPQKHTTVSIQPGSQTHHFLCYTNRLQCQIFTAHQGHTPLPMAEGAEFQLCFEHQMLAPVTIREQQGWAALEQGEACLHHGQGSVLHNQGAVLQHLIYSLSVTVHITTYNILHPTFM